MPAGSKPGERRGGIKKGGRHKRTIEREIVAAQDSRKPPPMLGKEVLAEFMAIYRGLAAKYQPPGGSIKLTPEQEVEQRKFDHYAMLAMKCAQWLAPYQSPTFRAIVMAGDVPNLEVTEVIELTIFDDHNKVIEHYPAEKRRLPKPAIAEAIDGDDDF